MEQTGEQQPSPPRRVCVGTGREEPVGVTGDNLFVISATCPFFVSHVCSTLL